MSNFFVKRFEATSFILKRWYKVGGSLIARNMYILKSKSKDKYVFIYVEEPELVFNHLTYCGRTVEMESFQEYRLNDGLTLCTMPKDLVEKHLNDLNKPWPKRNIKECLLYSKKARLRDFDPETDAVDKQKKFCRLKGNTLITEGDVNFYAENAGRAGLREDTVNMENIYLTGLATSSKGNEIHFMSGSQIKKQLKKQGLIEELEILTESK